MSVKVTSWVWENSRAEKSVELLVHLAFADYAHDDGGGSFPSVETVARKARTSRRTALRCIQCLLDRGDLELSGRTPRGTKIYRVVMGVPKWHTDSEGGGVTNGTRGGAKSDREGVTGDTPLSIGEPLKEPSKEPSSRSRRSEVEEAFSHWLKVTEKNGKGYQLTAKRAGAVDALLKKGTTLEEIKLAIEGNWGDSWHRERDKNDLELICRSRDHLERYRDKRLAQIKANGKPADNGFAAFSEVIERG